MMLSRLVNPDGGGVPGGGMGGMAGMAGMAGEQGEAFWNMFSGNDQLMQALQVSYL